MTGGKTRPKTSLKELEIMPRTIATTEPATIDPEAAIRTEALDKPSASYMQGVAFAATYEDRGQIGHGGMGTVRRAFDTELQRLVAIKSMLPELKKSESLMQRFIDEARITALIDHPNIAPVYRLGHGPDGMASLVMKLIEGRTFSSYIYELPQPPWPSSVMDAALSIFVKICDAVAFAHSKGVLHIDIKPENVMLGAFGQVYVVDWGIARYRPPTDSEPTLRTMSPKNASMGTPAYMSPEQALNKEDRISERTDVFLLGGMLYEMLTCERPHGGRVLADIMKSAAKCAIQHPLERAPHRSIPVPLATIAMKALSARPENRHQSVLELQQEVAAYQRGEERAPRRHYKTGAVVVKEGESGNEAFVIVNGRCVVTSMSTGQRVVLRELGPGDVFGETAVFSEEARTATVEATEPLMVRVVTSETLSETLGLDTWAGEFIKALADRFREADRRARGLAAQATRRVRKARGSKR